MTKIILNRILFLVITFYFVVIVTLVYLKVSGLNQDYYAVLKDLLPIIFAIPAAYLAFCFQRRNEYLKALRTVYSQLVQMNTDFTEYTYCKEKNNEKYFKLKNCISKAIEEIRSVYENIDENFGVNDGLYPFEPLKDIYYKDLELLHHGDFKVETNEEIRGEYYKKWKEIRINFIVELERAQASFPVTKYSRKKINRYERIKRMFKRQRQQFFRKKITKK